MAGERSSCWPARQASASRVRLRGPLEPGRARRRSGRAPRTGAPYGPIVAVLRAALRERAVVVEGLGRLRSVLATLLPEYGPAETRRSRDTVEAGAPRSRPSPPTAGRWSWSMTSTGRTLRPSAPAGSVWPWRRANHSSSSGTYRSDALPRGRQLRGAGSGSAGRPTPGPRRRATPSARRPRHWPPPSWAASRSGARGRGAGPPLALPFFVQEPILALRAGGPVVQASGARARDRHAGAAARHCSRRRARSRRRTGARTR